MRNLNKHVVGYGILVFLGLSIYFLAMEALGLVHNFNLRIINGLIMFAGIFWALRTFKKKNFDRTFNYIQGIGAGFFIALIGTVGFALFMAGYLWFNPEFMEAIKSNEPQGGLMNAPAVLMLILIEGLASGILFTYTSMQYLKPSLMASKEKV